MKLLTWFDGDLDWVALAAAGLARGNADVAAALVVKDVRQPQLTVVGV